MGILDIMILSTNDLANILLAHRSLYLDGYRRSLFESVANLCKFAFCSAFKDGNAFAF